MKEHIGMESPRMTIRKGIVVPFLPCLVAFWGFHPYMFFIFLNVFLLLVSVFCGHFDWLSVGLKDTAE